MTLVLQGLGRRYGARAALDEVSLQVADGEFLALLGPSGSGKTTLLRAIAGLEALDRGSLVLGGRDLTRLPARDRAIGFVFQSYALFRHMTVRENVAFGLRVRPRASRPSRRDIAARVEELLALVRLSDLAGQRPGQLSGGQQQRVALARALAPRLDQPGPRLLLLDEPFGALDPVVRKELRLWFRSLHDRLGLTTILVTHDQEEAHELADRIALLRDGRLEQVGTPGELERHPANAFVHGFLGETIRFDGTVRDGWLHFIEAGLPVLPTTCPDGPATALIRTHRLRLMPDGPFRVLRVHDAGPAQRASLALHARLIEVPLDPDRVPVPGAECGLDLSAARIFAAPPGAV